jgi:hypothetical protein
MRIRYFLFVLFFFICLTFNAFTQVSIKDSAINATLIQAHYSYQFPGGDLKYRFGNNSSVGGGITYKFKKNWVLGAEASFIFGENIKNEYSILSNIATKEGYIIDANGTYTEIRMYERGFQVGGTFGKIIPFFSHNPNSGLTITLGGGYIQHKIRIEDRNNATPQLKKDYLKGYDQLTDGFYVNGFLGYVYLGNNKLVSFYAGIEYNLAYTQSVRGYSFTTMEYDNKKRTDILTGVKIGWIIPLYQQAPAKYYYN